MGRIKAYYHEQLQQDYTEPAMTETELEDMLDYLYEEYMMKHEAYAYEDNPNPNSVEKARADKNTGCSGD
jgi:hypothetical protein